MLLEVLYNPEKVQEFVPDEIIAIFEYAFSILREEPAFINIGQTDGEVTFVGDTHGDFLVTKFIVRRFLEEHDKRYLIFLGDYIDREPEPEGSLYNLIYLCLLKINFPQKVFLLKGNHEAHYSIYCHPYEFDRELIDIFGSFGVKIHNSAVEVFKEMPLMIKTQNGIIASHAGFPLHGQIINHKSRQDLIIDILWSDPAISPVFRGYDIPKFTEEKLSEYLSSQNAKCFIRGHDPYLASKIIYSKKCLTIFTCRSYAYRAGITIASTKLSKNIKNAEDLLLENLTSYFVSSE